MSNTPCRDDSSSTREAMTSTAAQCFLKSVWNSRLLRFCVQCWARHDSRVLRVSGLCRSSTRGLDTADLLRPLRALSALSPFSAKASASAAAFGAAFGVELGVTLAPAVAGLAALAP